MIKIYYIAFLLFLAGCGNSSTTAKKKVFKPASILTEECHVCSMVVREQPSPRGQVVHRDGTRYFLCSVSEMIQYIKVPSSHGKVVSSWVETMNPKNSPKNISTIARNWKLSDLSFYVEGIKRKGIMGKAIMCFATKEDALKFIKKFGGHGASFEELKKIIGQ